MLNMVAPLEPGICCAHLDRQIAFYRDVLGFRVHSVIDVGPEKSAPPGLTPDGYRIARLESRDGQRIKFAQPRKPPQRRAAEPFVLSRQGAAYLTFLISDLDALIATLTANKVPLLAGDGKFEVRDGLHLAFARDPEGNFLEFLEYADISIYRPELGFCGRGADAAR
jgi:catechol 2,3-dioxygenase-like lactoylglutathione lyase family enzyme